MAKDSSPGAGDAFNGLSAAIRELQAQVTQDVLNLRARVLALEQELEGMRGQPKAPPQDKQEPPASKAGARGTTRRAPATAAKSAAAKDAKGTTDAQAKSAAKSAKAKSAQAKSQQAKSAQAKSPTRSRSKT